MMAPGFSQKKFKALSHAKQQLEAGKALVTLGKSLLTCKLNSNESGAAELRNALNTYHCMIKWSSYKLPPLFSENDTLHAKKSTKKAQKELLNKLTERYHLHRHHFAQNQNEELSPFLQEDFTPSLLAPTIEPASFLPIHIYLDRIRYPQNIGSIARTTEALRLGQLVFPKNQSVPTLDHPQAQKTSMHSFHNLLWTTAKLEDCPRPWIALEQGAGSVPIDTYTFPKTTGFTLIIGNEEDGVCEKILSQVDALVEITQYGLKNCLNVACAFAICAHTIRRKRKG